MSDRFWLTAAFYDNRNEKAERKVAFFLFPKPEDYDAMAVKDTGRAEALIAKEAAPQLRKLFGVKGGKVSLGSIDSANGDWTIFVDHVAHKKFSSMMESIEAGEEVGEEAYDLAELDHTWNFEGMYEFNFPEAYAAYQEKQTWNTEKQQEWYNWLSANGVPLLPPTNAVKASMKVTPAEIEAKRQGIFG